MIDGPGWSAHTIAQRPRRAALPLGWEGENFLSGKKQVQAQVQIISTPVK